MEKPLKTKDGVVPVEGMILYDLWNGAMHGVKVIAYNIDTASGATIPTVVHMFNGSKVRASADMFYASEKGAWEAELVENEEGIQNMDKQIAEIQLVKEHTLEFIEVIKQRIAEAAGT
jgi:hypothetical protein